MAEESGNSLRSAKNENESIESKTPEVTSIEALRKQLVVETVTVDELEMEVKKLKPIVKLANDLYKKVKEMLGHVGETAEEMAGAAELEAELEAEDNDDYYLRSSEIVIDSTENPEVAELRYKIAAKNLRGQKLESKVKQLEPIVKLAKDLYKQMKEMLGHVGETAEEMAGAADLEAELEAQQDGNVSIPSPENESTTTN